MRSSLDRESVHLWMLNAAEVDALTDYHYSLLNTDEINRLNRLRTTETRSEYISSHGAVRYLLGCYLDADPAHIEFGRAEFGKPFVAFPTEPTIFFNMAHSNGTTICAFSSQEIGVDIEVLNADIVTQKLVRTVFTPAEQRTLALLSRERGESRAFFTMWTLKESYIKATGLGLSADLQSLSVTLEPEAPGMAVCLSESGGQSPWRLYSVDAGAEYAAALTAKEQPHLFAASARPVRDP